LVKIIYVLVALTLSCSKNEVVDTTEPSEAVQVINVSCLGVEVSPVTDPQKTATLVFDLSSCVEAKVGEDAQRLEKGDSLVVPADEKELQRITIDGYPILMRLKPGSIQRFSKHPESGWQLDGDRFAPEPKALVELVLPSAWTEAVQFLMPGETELRPMPGPIDPPLEFEPRRHHLLQVDTGDERVDLALGAGEHWVLRVTPGGKLFGAAKDR